MQDFFYRHIFKGINIVHAYFQSHYLLSYRFIVRILCSLQMPPLTLKVNGVIHHHHQLNPEVIGL